MSAGNVLDANGTKASVAAYLDERSVLDLLASLDNGFASVETVTVRTATNTQHETNVSGEAGVSGWLSGLGRIGFGTSKKSADGKDIESDKEAARYHTSGSLLHQLRRTMESKEILLRVKTDHDCETLEASDFVEVRGAFAPNPFIHPLATYERFLDLMEAVKAQPSTSASTSSTRRSGNGQSAKSSKPSPSAVPDYVRPALADLRKDQIPFMMLESEGIENYVIVMAVDTQHLQVSSLNELYDGEYRVLAQVLRHLPKGATGSLNLIRGSALGEMRERDLHPVMESIKKRIEAENWEMREPIATINPPFLRLRPVAIYP